MVEHDRVAVADRPRHPQRVRQDRALEGDLLFRLVDLDAVQPGDEIIVPIGAAVFAVGGGPQPDGFLLGDRLDDGRVLDGAQRGVVQPAGLVRGPGLGEAPRAQQAAHVVGAERRAGARHGGGRGDAGGHVLVSLDARSGPAGGRRTPPGSGSALCPGPARPRTPGGWNRGLDPRPAWTGTGGATITPAVMPIQRLLVRLADASRRHAALVVLAGVLLTLLSVFYAGRHLGVTTDTDTMFSATPALAAARRWRSTGNSRSSTTCWWW